MIVATAGHVDHGKTLLVKKLTGMDTDRLEEEKRRGLSINLGFAYREIKNGSPISFIDVPGHNRFINNMIAGINGIDIGMLVVAADDGPMPQTQEHIDVLVLLGVERFVLVVSKIDRVEQARVDEVRDATLSLFPEQNKVPVFAVNTPASDGISQLAEFLENEADKLLALSSSGYFRLSIDRAFLIKGSGLIVTGTVASGSIKVDESLMLVPQNISVRIRSLQVQEKQEQEAVSGQRCALNIVGDVEKDDIERGDCLVDPRTSETTTRIDARVMLLQHAPFPIKHMSPIKLYIGARRISARLALYGEKTLAPGQGCLAQLQVESGIHCCRGDRFLLRDDSENQTLGGGVVLDPRASASKRSNQLRMSKLEATEQDTPKQVLQELLFELKQMVNIGQFCLSWNICPDEQKESLGLAEFEDEVDTIELEDEKYIVASSHWQKILAWVKNELDSIAQDDNGMQLSTLKTKFTKTFPGIDSNLVFNHMQSAGVVTLSKERIALCKKQIFSQEQEERWLAIENHLRSCGLNVPVVSDLAKALGCEQRSVLELAGLASKEKLLVMPVKNRMVLREHIKDFAAIVQSLSKQQDGFSVAEFKNECGIGRNLAIEVLEYFDKIGFTLRKESRRVVLHDDRVDTKLN